MARSDDKKDGKRGPSRPKTASTPKKETTAGARKGATPPAASRKKAAARRATPPAKAKSTPLVKGKSTPPVKAASAKAGSRVARPAAPSRPARPSAAARKPNAPRAKTVAVREKAGAPVLDEEQRIEDAKYQPRDLPPRLFEEERFVFPESYGQSRIRLLVKDPEWLFAHWDVDPQSLADLRAELGERASALSRLTLRVSDPQHGGESRVLLPDGSRSWYVRADSTERTYRAQLGLTLPSGEFRSLAESNTVRTPRTGPAPGAAPRRARYDGVVVSSSVVVVGAASAGGRRAAPILRGPEGPRALAARSFFDVLPGDPVEPPIEGAPAARRAAARRLTAVPATPIVASRPAQ